MNKCFSILGLSFILLLMFSCDKRISTKNNDHGFDISAIDSTVLPCDDFDQFANGMWKKNTQIPSTESSWGAFEILYKANEEKQKGILDGLLKNKNHKKGSNEQLIADYYRAFLDTISVEKRKTAPLDPYFIEIDKAASYSDLLKFYGKMPNIDNFFNFYVDADQKDTKTNIFTIVQSGLALGDREYYLSSSADMENIRKEYKKHIFKMHRLLGMDSLKAVVATNSIYNLEAKLANFHKPKELMRDPIATYNKRTIAELKALTPNINWDKYFEGIGKTPKAVVIDNLDLFAKMNATVNTIPLADWKAYFKWQLLVATAGNLNKELDKENFHFFRTIKMGIAVQKPRDERALRNTNRTMGEPFGKLFVEKYFPASSKKKIGEMIENLRIVYKERVDKLDWMSDSTKVAAKTKLDAFTYKIGFPDKWKDYSKVDIQADKLFENVMAMAKYDSDFQISKIDKPVDKSEWGMTPQEVNAYYNPMNNEVVFPAGILQPPFYNPNADDAINYGAIMAVIGHEFTHGFDDQGSQFGPDGNLNDWWSAVDKVKFGERTGKMVAHYNKFEVLPNLFVNGEFTQGENIADQGGLILAYYALLKSVEGKPEPKLIDGFTYKQRFFLGWAQVWRDKTNDEALKQLIASDPHSPPKARINAAVSNLQEFYDAWGCKGGKMFVPVNDRAIVW